MQGILKQQWMKTAQTVCWRRCWRSQTDCWWSLCWCWKKKVEVSVKKGIVLYCFENYLLPGSLQNGSVKHKCDLLFFAFNNIYRLKTFLFPFLIKFEINNNSLSLAQWWPCPVKDCSIPLIGRLPFTLCFYWSKWVFCRRTTTWYVFASNGNSEKIRAPDAIRNDEPPRSTPADALTTELLASKSEMWVFD